MIDDKIGGVFKPIPQCAYKTLRDSANAAWDLGSNSTELEYWVRCPSVFSPGRSITRALGLNEVAALWDYMLPDMQELPASSRKDLLVSLLHGPPGKLLRKVAYGPLRFFWNRIDLPAIPNHAANREIDYTATTVEDRAIKGSHLKAS